MTKIKITKIFSVLFLIFILGAYLIFPFVSNATLVPCGRSDQGGSMCTLCHLIIGIKGLIDYGFTIMLIVGIVMIVIAGIVYIVSAGNDGVMKTAKGLLTNALVGFGIILGAWLIINTTMWVLGTKGDLGIGVHSWNSFTCNSSSTSGGSTSPNQTQTPPTNPGLLNLVNPGN